MSKNTFTTGTFINIVAGMFDGFSGVVVGSDYVAPNGNSKAQDIDDTTPIVLKCFGIPVVANIPNDYISGMSKDDPNYSWVVANLSECL